MQFAVKKEILEKVLNYLAARPFIEVQGMINDLQQAKPINKEETVKEESKSE